jgi:hypothetical protein
MTFVGWQHPLTGYTPPVEEAGLLIEAIGEPLAHRWNGAVADVPFHLWFRVRKPA